MKSYTGLRNLYGKFTKNTASANLTQGDELMNDSVRRIIAMAPWDFVEKTRTATTVASQQAYNLPADYDKLISVTVTIGNVIYTPKEAISTEFWNKINTNTSVTSNIPNYFYIFNKQILFWPMPSSSSNTITYRYKRKIADLNLADYTTGNIDIITNAATTVTGAGTPAWTSPMAGRYLRVTGSNTAASSGDNLWYEISSITNSTTLELVSPYLGTSLTTGAAGAYIIGQMSILPENYQDMPAYDAASVYWTYENDPVRAKMYADMFANKLRQLRGDHLNKTTDQSVDNDYDIINPNLTIIL